MAGCKNGISSIEVLAPNGQPSVLYARLEQQLGKDEALKAYLKVHTPEFKEWFGDWKNSPETSSKVVDENGEPMVVYHYTPNSFNSFNKDESIDGGIYFTDTLDGMWKDFAGMDKEANTMPVFLNIKSPDIRKSTEDHFDDGRFDDNSGLDGRIILDKTDSEYVVYDPNQIKSISNKGEFSKENDNIFHQKLSTSGRKVDERVIRDIAASLSERIGIPVEFVDDENTNWKGVLHHGVAKINLAHATMDTPIHEIVGHPIIRSIRNNPNQNKLYRSLVAELDKGTGKKILDRIKKDYPIARKKVAPAFYEWLQASGKIEVTNDTRIFGAAGTSFNYKGNLPKSDMVALINKVASENYDKYFDEFMDEEKPSLAYTLEDQQEEAIVELLGLLTANKLHKLRDGSLITKLKEILASIKKYVKELLLSKEIDVSKLPENITLGDLSDILAYGKNKLLIPEYTVRYTTPDNNNFSTYAEASAHVSSLANLANEPVDLNNISLTKDLTQEEKAEIARLERLIKEQQDELNSENYKAQKEITIARLTEEIANFTPEKAPLNERTDFYLPAGVIPSEFEYVRLRYSHYPGFDGDMVSLFDKSDGMDGMMDLTEEENPYDDYEGFVIYEYTVGKEPLITKISMEEAEELHRVYGNQISNGDREYQNRLRTNLQDAMYDTEIQNRIYRLQRDLERAKVNPLEEFIRINNELEQSKQVVEEWKEVNGVVYDPEEIYSRGQAFYSVVGAYSDFDVDLMFQNILTHLDDNKRVGSGMTISAFTRPVNRRLNHLEGADGKIRFAIFPQSKDIKWASTKDVYSGSLSHHGVEAFAAVSNKQKELVGVSFTKYPATQNLYSVTPNLADAIDKINHAHNELGIDLTHNNFRIEYDDNIPATTKKIIDKVNSILDEKYGELVRPEINEFTDDSIAKEPTLTSDKLKISIDQLYIDKFMQMGNANVTSIEEVPQRFIAEHHEVFKTVSGWMMETLDGGVTSMDEQEVIDVYNTYGRKTKEVTITDQAMTNMKLAKLKEHARKYPRSLIRSSVEFEKRYQSNWTGAGTEPLYQLAPKEENYYKGQKMNDKQSTVVNDMLEAQKVSKLSDDEATYLINGIPHERVSNFLFGSAERNRLSPHYKAQGNVYHKVVEDIILGKSFMSVVSEVDIDAGVPTAGLEKFYNEVKAFIDSKKKDGVVFMAEMKLHYTSDDLKIGGAADIIAINPDGTIDVYDLKTSKHSTIADGYTNDSWKIDGGYFAGQELTKKQSHAAQQTVYGRMIEAMGHTVNSLNILPYVITRDDTNTVISATKEASFSLRPNIDLAKSIIPSLPEKKVNIVKESKIEWSTDILEDVKVFLEKRLQRVAATMHTQKDREAAEKKINQHKADIAKVEDAKKVARFIEIAFDELAGEKGFANRFDKLKASVNADVLSGNITVSEGIAKLEMYRAYAEGYSVLDTILGANRNVNFSTKDGDSVIELLNRAILAKNHILNEYNSTVDDLMASWLSEQASENINTVAAAEIAKLSKRIEVAKKSGASESHIANLEERLLNYRDSVADKDSIKEALHVIRKDVGLADYWLSPLISSGNKALALFAKQIKKTLEGVRLYLMKFQKEMHNEYKLYEASVGYSNNVAKVNEGLYEKRIIVSYDEDGNPIRTEVAAFVDRTDWNKYTEAKLAMYEATKDLGEDSKKAARSAWFEANKEPMEVSEANKIIEEHRATMDRDGFNRWIKNNMYNANKFVVFKRAIEAGVSEENALDAYATELLNAHNQQAGLIKYRNSLTQPRESMYYNSAYSRFEDSAPNTAAKRYYNYLVSTYKKAQERLPVYARRGMILPSVPKANSDRLIEQRFAGAKAIGKEAVNYSAEDDATLEYRSLDDKDKSLPIKYVSTMKFEDVSLNLASSIALFEESTLKYKEITGVMPQVNAMMELVSKAKVLKTNSRGQNLVDSTAKKLGIDDKYVQKHGGNLAAAQLESFIDMQIYGSMSEKETWGSVDIGKVADTLIGITAQTTIAWDILKPVSNSLQANVMLALEGFAREHVTKRSLASAKGDYLLAQGQILSDATKPFNTSLIGQMTDLFDAIQGKFSDEYGKTLGWNAAKRSVTSKTGFMLMNMGEHEVQTTLMLAIMKDTKLMLGGQQITLDKAYEIGEDGIIKLKDGVTKLDGSEWTEQDRFDFMNKLHAINKRLHGVYNNFDRVHLKRFAAGRLMMLFRNFLVPAIKRRYKGLSGDQELGAHTEGFYITFWNAFGKDLVTLKWKNLVSWDELSDMEKANVKRFIGEMGSIAMFAALTVAIGMAASGTDDDDLPGYLIHYALYQTTRVRSELFAYLNPMDALRVLRSPSASTTSIERIMKVFYYLTVDPAHNAVTGEDKIFSVYEKEQGKFEKGDLKLSAAIQKLFGLHGRSLNPEDAVKLLNFNR
jgi:hypothetical protein